MKRSRFIIVTLLVIISLVVLITVEVLWAMGNYRDMRDNYNRQIESILEESSWQYTSASVNSASYISIGNIERFHAIVAEELRTSGIDSDFRVEALSTTDDEPITLMSMGGEDLGEDKLSFDKEYLPLILRLTVEDPHTKIMESMRSILILQGASILLLIIAFVYLLTTLFRAKSVDTIRRDLTHNITHELKTPIAAAYAATDTLLTMPDIAETKELRDDYLRMTYTELQRLDNIVEEILRTATENSDKAELRLEECDIEALANNIIASLNMKYTSREVKWNVTIDEECSVVADKFHLMGMMSALMDNAIKYSPKAAVVTIKATIDHDYTVISISDVGMGISSFEQRRIFDKFYRINQGNRHDTKGYGMGLYYVHTMAKRHGGSVGVKSSYGQGSTFTLKLPRYGK
jgi:signal transduction histidine kinase